MYAMKKIINLLAVFLFGVGILFLIAALQKRQPYQTAQTENAALRKTMVSYTGDKEETDPFRRSIDFDFLKKLNPHIAAWVYIPGTNIDYPVLIGENNTQYLQKNFRGEKSSLGAVFGFADMDKDFMEAHLCLFAHNMRSPQMFGELKKYKTEKFAEHHQKLYCYTPLKVTEYQLISVYECAKNDESFEHKMQRNSNEYFKLLRRITESNTIKTAAKDERMISDGERQIMTLSCCSEYRRTVNRMTVHFLETKSVPVTDLGHPVSGKDLK